MTTCPRTLAALLALLVSTVASARAGAGTRCQDTLADGGGQILGRSLAALATCRARIARGTLPPTTDCDDAATRANRAAAVARLGRRIQRACAVAPVAPGGDCAGARTTAALAACVPAAHDGRAVALLHVVDATAGKLPVAARRCEGTASREVRHFVLARLHVLQQCKADPPADLAPAARCGSDATSSTRIAALRTAAAARIAARCTGDALAGARFGAPCATAPDLAACLLATGDDAGDAALAAEYPDTGFCGDAGAAVDARIDALLAQMPLPEKIEQMHGATRVGISYTVANAHLPIPGLVMIDGPRGVGVTLGHATSFPVGMARAATWDPDLEQQVGGAMGAEARAKGASMLLAPTMNMLRHPRWGRAQETYGEDTLLLGRMATGFIRGVQAQHVIASAKHFAGNSIEDTRFSVNVTMDERTLREVYLPHFRMAVQAGHTGSVMSAYNQLDGHYCAENAHLLHDVLDGDWGFQGFVESDWTFGTRSTLPSLTAGLDIEMPYGVYYAQPLADAAAANQAVRAEIDAAVRRILRAQLCFQLDSDPPVVDPTQVETPAHADVALAVAREGIVLLKNAGGALPLDRTRLSSIVVVGAPPPVTTPATPDLATMANLGDHGSSTVVPSHPSVTPLDGILAAAGSVTVTHVVAASPPPVLAPADETAIAAADAVVVVVGLTFNEEGEGLITHGDRDNLVLPRDEDALVAAVAALNPRTIVVLEGSGPVVMPWVDAVPAILAAWYPGQAGGTAIADVLFGDVNPSGKLPLSFPLAEADLPPFDNTSSAVTYDFFHGYRYLDVHGTTPLFPFGFGLSYTTFTYANLTVTPATTSAYGLVRVTADVTNTGPVAGDEVAELYVGYQGSAVSRAVNDLKDFARVHLAPGETQTVAFELRAADLAFWNVTAGGWQVEPIPYVVRVGPSSRDLPLETTVTVAP